MQPSEQELVGIPDYYVWTGIRAELKASSHRVRITQDGGELRACVDLCRSYSDYTPAVIVPCDDPFRLNIKLRGAGAWVVKTKTPVTTIVSGTDHLYVEMLPLTRRRITASLVGKARWFRHDEDTYSWECYRLETCLFGEVAGYNKSEVRAWYAD